MTGLKKIMLSLGMVVVVGAVVASGTGAFFSDTETSTGNTFTAGAIDLKVDSEQHYNGNVCVLVGQNYVWQGNAAYPVPGSACDGTWLAADLGAQKFFNFLDVKPGDRGENTISLYIDNNPAWACVDVSITKNDDVDCTEPENAAVGGENGACQNNLPSADFDGELAQNLNFFAWVDDGAVDGWQGKGQDTGEGDNIWQAGENPLFSNGVGPASDVLYSKTYTLAAPNVAPALAGGTTHYIGLEWCAGTLTIVSPGVLSCNGASMGNNAQTDSMVANITFRVEQSRNNPGFTCNPT